MTDKMMFMRVRTIGRGRKKQAYISVADMLEWISRYRQHDHCAGAISVLDDLEVGLRDAQLAVGTE